MKALCISLGLTLLLLAACEPVTTITVRTDAPPGREARIDQIDEIVRISPDVAVAIECTFYDPFSEEGPVNRACDDLEAEAARDGIVKVLPAYLDGAILSGTGSAPGAAVDPTGRDRAIVVLLGKQAGETELEIRHADASFTFDLVVEAVGSGD